MPIAVPISPEAHSMLEELASRSGESVPTVLERAIEAYRRQRFWEESNLAFEQLRARPDEWRDELEERREWDSTLSDDLQSDEPAEPLP